MAFEANDTGFESRSGHQLGCSNISSGQKNATEASSILRRDSEDNQYHTEFRSWINLQNRAWTSCHRLVRSKDRCQARLLTLTLSLSPGDVMKTSTYEGKHGIQWTSRMQLDDLDFADDLAILSQTQQQMRKKTISVAADSATVGINIHKGKSKILRHSTAWANPVTIDGEDLEDVKSVTYLGSTIDEHGGSDADVMARIGKARAAYLQLRIIWNSKQLSTNTK
ncbi:unnamed protein product [Schistosoma mattheei]|uniref:Uncharacterized protein n=1 Tax=Schistosoma mattheei TaxID=31246 RepID=A0A183PJI6_9TREM|nr:unnamed protein product [Schistosoma mattheei]